MLHFDIKSGPISRERALGGGGSKMKTEPPSSSSGYSGKASFCSRLATNLAGFEAIVCDDDVIECKGSNMTQCVVKLLRDGVGPLPRTCQTLIKVVLLF